MPWKWIIICLDENYCSCYDNAFTAYLFFRCVSWFHDSTHDFGECSSQNAYYILGHSNWHGGTLADLVFPFFFICRWGDRCDCFIQTAITYRPTLYYEILKRSLLLFACWA